MVYVILPWLAFISAIGAAMALMIVSSKLTTIYFKNRHHPNTWQVSMMLPSGLGKASATVMFNISGNEIDKHTHEGAWTYLNTPTGHCPGEITILAIVPMMYYYGVLKKNPKLIQVTGV